MYIFSKQLWEILNSHTFGVVLHLYIYIYIISLYENML